MLSKSIPEIDNQFLQIFPHRWDHLWSEHPKPGESPNWQTESRYPLSDRSIEQGKYLYGVRFGRETRYFMLDIDRESPYHPKRDPLAIGRLMNSLEVLGFTDCVAITSSYSGGLHLYYPIAESVASWELAAVVTHRLSCSGFIIEDGLLEVFPNNRNYDASSPTLFKAHRLPLQQGSYLLNKSFDLCYTSQDSFCAHWAFCQYRNQINPISWKLDLEDATRKTRKISYRAKKFIADLNADINAGWSSHGQTNYLLGRITLRAYVFGHVLDNSEPLTGDRLVNEIVKTATQLPGYKEWCRHQSDIFHRASEWARCAENSHYYPYGGQSTRIKGSPEDETRQPVTISWNEWNKERARQRLCFAIADLLNREALPASTRDRFMILTQQYGFSGETLYKNDCLDLWHPDYLWKTPPHPPNISKRSGEFCAVGANSPESAKTLLDEAGCKPLQQKDYNGINPPKTNETGCNTGTGEDYSHFRPDSRGLNWWDDVLGGAIDEKT